MSGRPFMPQDDFLRIIERRLLNAAPPPPFTPPAPPAAAIHATLAKTTLASIGETTTIQVLDENGTDVTAGCTFSDGTPATATTNASGTVTAAANGSDVITVTQTSRSLTTTVTAQVTQAVASAGISPATATVARGDTQAFTLSPKDANGHPVASPPTPAYAVTSNKNGAAFGTVSSSGVWTAEAGASGDMVGTLKATYPNGVVSAAAAVTVGTPTLASLSPTNFVTGQTAQSFTIGGTEFADDSVVTVTGNAGVTVTDSTRVSATSITGHISVASNAAIGSATLDVSSAALGVTLATSIGITQGAGATAPAVNKSTGEYIMGAQAGSLPIYWVDPVGGSAGGQGRTNAGPFGTGTWSLASDSDLRGLISSGLAVVSDPTKAGTYPVNGGDNTMASRAIYDDGQHPDLVDYVTDPGPTFNYHGPALRYKFPGTNTIGETNTGELRMDFTTSARPQEIWAFRAYAYATDFVSYTNADNTHWAHAWAAGERVTGAFTITPAITTTGVQTVATSTQYATSACNKMVVIIEPGGANQETLTYDGSASPAAGKWSAGADGTHIVVNPTKTHVAGVTCDISFNAADGGLGGQGSGFKSGMFCSLQGTRCGMYEIRISDQSGAVDMSAPPNGGSDGVQETSGSYNFTNTGPFRDGNLYGWAMRIRQFTKTVGGVTTRYIGQQIFMTTQGYTTLQALRDAIYTGGANVWQQLGPYAIGTAASSTLGSFWEAQGSSENMNHPMATTFYRAHVAEGAFAAETYTDPFNILAQVAGWVPEAPSAASVNGSPGSTTQFNVTIGRFTGSLRAQVDGAWVTGQDFAIPEEVGEVNGHTVNNQYPASVVTPTLTGLTAGTHTVVWYGVSRDGSKVSTTGASVSVTVASVPGAPTAANASAETASSLTFPVTLNSSGSLPTALAVQYSTDNATWTNGAEISLSSPTLGQGVNATVNVPAASTLYYVQFAEKNGAGQSGWSASATGTTSASASVARSVLYPTDSLNSTHPSATQSSALPLAENTNTIAWTTLAGSHATGGANPYIYAAGNGGPSSAILRGFVSMPLVAQTLPTGTYTLRYGMYSESGAAYQLAPVIYVYRPSTSSVVGRLVDSATGIGTASSGSTAATAGRVATVNVTSAIAVQDGDVLVWEWWFVGSPASNNYLHNEYAGTGQITEGCDTGSAAQAEIDFPAAINFQS